METWVSTASREDILGIKGTVDGMLLADAFSTIPFVLGPDPNEVTDVQPASQP